MYSIKDKEQIILILEPLNLKEEEKNSLIAYLDYARISVSSIVKHKGALLKINSYFSENRYHRNSINTILAKAVLQYVSVKKIIEIDKVFKEYDYSARERETIETTFYRIFHKNPEVLKKSLLFYSDFNLKSEIISNPYRMKHQITSLYAKYRYLADQNVHRRVIVNYIFNSDEMFCYEFSISKEKLFEKYPLPDRYKIQEKIRGIYTAREKKLLNLFFLKIGITTNDTADLINKLEIQGIQYEQIKEHLEDIKVVMEHFKTQGYEQLDINTIISQADVSTDAPSIIEIENLFDENNDSLEVKHSKERFGSADAYVKKMLSTKQKGESNK